MAGASGAVVEVAREAEEGLMCSYPYIRGNRPGSELPNVTDHA